MRRMHRAGIKLGVGTDLIVDWYRQLPAPYINELKYFTAVGYTPAEALVAATKTNAELLDMDDKLGTLESGKLADVLVVERAPRPVARRVGQGGPGDSRRVGRGGGREGVDSAPSADQVAQAVRREVRGGR